MNTARIAIRNNFKVPRAIFVEPWANDYTLLPDERLEIIALGDADTPSFEIVEWFEGVQVYCNHTDDFKVLQNGIELECGHNRQPDGPA